MLIVTFQFSFKVTTDRSPECSSNILTGTNQKLEIPLSTLVWEYFEAHGQYLNNFRRPIVGSTNNVPNIMTHELVVSENDIFI